jgi:preprotein translocase SecE subunit
VVAARGIDPAIETPTSKANSEGLAMAVAVKTSSETAPRTQLRQNLAVSSFVGALYVLFGVGMVFTGLPVLWNDVLEINKTLNVFLSDALLLIVLLVAAVGFVVVGKVLEGPHPPHGLRAGTFVAALALFLIGLLALGLGSWLETQDAWIQIGITVLVAGGLLYGLAWLFFKPGFLQWLGHIEDQGWFYATPFKPNQGLRVRRGTVIALLVLVGCGIYTMLLHNALGRGDWAIDLPWGDNLYVPILLNVQYTVPLLLLIVLGWLSWRVVNWPVFADFLIATEAEMNKVSWTTRKRLFQDTIVVLVTVFLLTLFLFFVDLFWVKILASRWVGVLPSDFEEQRQKLNEQTQW